MTHSSSKSHASTKQKGRHQSSEYIQNLNTAIPNRYINQRIPFQIIPKSDFAKCDMPKNKIIIPLTNSQCRIPYNYKLSHLPIFSAKSHLQIYNIPFTNEQLGEMFKAPKIIIDRWHDVFISNQKVMHRTSFYAVAPNPFSPEYQIPQNNFEYSYLINETYLPILYRFSIIRDLENNQHYTITAHALVGGAEDGWLFLARLDNNSEVYHDFMTTNTTSDFVTQKKHSVPVTCLNPKQKEMMDFFNKSIGNENGDEVYRGVMHRIAFPHIHQAEASYVAGDSPEESCPKFLKNCVNNTFGENVAFMMKALHISDELQFYSNDVNLKDIISEKRNSFSINPEPNPSSIIKEICILEHYNSGLADKLAFAQQTNKPSKEKSASKEGQNLSTM